MGTKTTTTANKGKGKAAAEAKVAKAIETDSNINVSLPALFNHSMPTRQEVVKNFKIALAAEVMGFFSWYNPLRKDFGKLCYALELHRKGETAEAIEVKKGLSDVALTVNDLITINRGDLSLSMVDQILIQGDAKPLFAVSDFLAQKEFADYQKRVEAGKAAKDKNGIVKPYKPTFDGKLWTKDRFVRCFLLACNAKHIKEQSTLATLAAV